MLIVNGDIVGGDNITTGTTGNKAIDEIIAAKLKAKKQEAEQGNASGSGVTINGDTIIIGGRVVSGDLIEKK